MYVCMHVCMCVCLYVLSEVRCIAESTLRIGPQPTTSVTTPIYFLTHTCSMRLCGGFNE
eukprot:m.3445 g.3445  ORF g.3445 m.3445 type:complete len:59 (+) comp4124_c0_seq1:142-318(+)